MKCPSCIEKKRKTGNRSLRVGNVPASGRAAQNNLCCKCDRELNGTQTSQDKGEKQLKKERRRKLQELFLQYVTGH